LHTLSCDNVYDICITTQISIYGCAIIFLETIVLLTMSAINR